MKTPSRTFLILTLSAAASPAQFAETTGQPAPQRAATVSYVETTTDEDVLARREQQPFGGGVPRDAVRKTYELADTSDFIAFSGLTTLVPKGAVLHVPERMLRNVVKAPEGDLLAWSEFFARHHSWITTVEVTLEEAAGTKAINPARLETAIRAGRIIVAVTQGNPTSVTPAKEAPVTP